jgi:hypothetical protein
MLKKRIKSLASDLEDTEEWKREFAAWAEALMAVIWGPTQRTAQRITALQEWVHESPV